MAVRSLAPLWLVVVAMGVAMAGHAMAQTSLDEPLDEHAAKRLDRMEKAMKELRAIVFQGRETGQPIVVQPADTQTQVANLSDKVGDLQQSLAKLNGELEVVRHDLDQSRQDAAEARVANAALRERLAGLEKAVQALTPPPPPARDPLTAPSAQVAPQDPAAAFAAARAAILAGDMATAETGFRDYVDKHGDGPGGPEARYNLARTLISRHAWADAATADIGAIRGWPHTRWAPDAVLDLSRALIGLQKPTDACQTLDELTRRYPKLTPGVARSAVDLRAQARCG